MDDLQNGANDTLNHVREGLNSIAGNGGPAPSPAPTPQAGTPPGYVPPLHGENPHGMGTGAVVDLVPETFEPLPYEEGGGSEDVVVGRSRGEQNGDEYHGHVTILSVLGTELIEGADTGEGESSNGPLGPLNDALDDVCTNSGGALCLNVLAVNSETTSSGSRNSFTAAEAGVELGPAAVSADVLSSTGNISETDSCQRSTGRSQVVGANALGLTAVVAESEANSKACADGTETQENSGQVINLGGTQVPIPPGCETGDPNTDFTPLAPLVSAVCNADDTNGAQADAPYGAREALSVFLLDILGGTPLAKVTTAGSEGHAVAPEGGAECPDPANPDCPQPPECPDPGNPACDDGAEKDVKTEGSEGEDEGGPYGDGPSAKADATSLPFSGADVLTLALIGAGVMGLGLLAMALADRRRKASV